MSNNNSTDKVHKPKWDGKNKQNENDNKKKNFAFTKRRPRCLFEKSGKKGGIRKRFSFFHFNRLRYGSPCASQHRESLHEILLASVHVLELDCLVFQGFTVGLRDNIMTTENLSLVVVFHVCVYLKTFSSFKKEKFHVLASCHPLFQIRRRPTDLN